MRVSSPNGGFLSSVLTGSRERGWFIHLNSLAGWFLCWFLPLPPLQPASPTHMRRRMWASSLRFLSRLCVLLLASSFPSLRPVTMHSRLGHGQREKEEEEEGRWNNVQCCNIHRFPQTSLFLCRGKSERRLNAHS